MTVCRWLGALTLVCAVAVGVNGGQAGGDRPVFKGFDDAGKSYWQEMKTETTQTMKVQGMEVQQTQKQTFFVKWTPQKKEGKTWKVDYEIVGVKMDITIGGNQISYDSTTKDVAPQNPLTDFFKALVGSKFVLTVTQDDKEGIKVTDVEGVDTFVTKLSASNAQLKPLLTSIMNKDALMQMTNPTFAAFPRSEDEFKKGSWTYPVVLNMGPIGSYDTTYTYTIDPKVKNKVDVSAQMKYTAPKEDLKDAGLPFKIKKGDLAAESANGTVNLDPKAGRVADATMNMNLKGNLTIEIAGQETTVELQQKQVSTVKTSETDPIAAKK
jgi:hypothetical protein